MRFNVHYCFPTSYYDKKRYIFFFFFDTGINKVYRHKELTLRAGGKAVHPCVPFAILLKLEMGDLATDSHGLSHLLWW